MLVEKLVELRTGFSIGMTVVLFTNDKKTIICNSKLVSDEIFHNYLNNSNSGRLLSKIHA